MTTRMGAPRVGDTVVIRMAGEAVRDVVVQVLARRVCSDDHVGEWYAIRTARFGAHPFARRLRHYSIED